MNQEKLGISGSMTNQLFFNEFASKILWNAEPLTSEELCRKKLEHVAFVNVEMTQTDAIVLSREVYNSISSVTVTGGIVSLYSGMSFTSLIETVFWFFKILVQLPLWLLRKFLCR